MSRLWITAAKVLALLCLLIVLAGAGLFYMLTSGPVSNEQLRARVESQLDTLLGDALSAKVRETTIEFGRSGFLSLDMHDAVILKDRHINLGIVEQLSVSLSALPLLRGEMIADSVELKSAQISVGRLIRDLVPLKDVSDLGTWPSSIDFSERVDTLGALVVGLARAVENAGLERVTIQDANLVGFDQVGLRSRTAQLKILSLERDKNFQEGLDLTATIETEHNTIEIAGTWRELEGDRRGLNIAIDGIDMRDVIDRALQRESRFLTMNSPVSLQLTANFDRDGRDGELSVVARLGGGVLKLGDELDTAISSAQFNLRLIREKNQIELEESPIQFAQTRAVLAGGLRYPRESTPDLTRHPIFELIANDVAAYGMYADRPPARGALKISGHLDERSQTLVADEMLLKTAKGTLSGKGSISLAEADQSVSLDLGIDRMDVEQFKQFWPSIIASGAHEWAQTGIEEGQVHTAWVKVRTTAQKLGGEGKLAPDEMVASIPVSGAVVKTVGDIPSIRSAEGTIDYAGMETTIKLDEGVVETQAGPIRVNKGTLRLGDHDIDPLPAELELDLSGTARAAARLGQYEPLSFTDQLGLKPSDLSGQVNAKITAAFTLDSEFETQTMPWTADVDLKGFASKSPVQGRTITDADLKIAAKPGVAKVGGLAKVDGSPAKLALVERFDSDAPSERVITLTLDEKAQKRLGISTSEVVSGPIDVTLSSIGTDRDVVEADLKNARIDLPWIGWSKGKGIPASAKFELHRSGNKSTLRNFNLSGKGFSARGTMVLDENGLSSADFRKVVLNKTDDFDVRAQRSASGYDISVKARSYDGRALIRRFLDNQGGTTKGGQTVKVTGEIAKLVGFNGESLTGVSLDYQQRGDQVLQTVVRAVARNNAPTTFSLRPENAGMRTVITSGNAGALLAFLDLYGKMQGGDLSANLIRSGSNVYSGKVDAANFVLLDEPRLAALLRKPTIAPNLREGAEVARNLPTYDAKRARVDRLEAFMQKGPGTLGVKGRLTGGNASAAFEGTVYDQNNRMDIRGTFLPARGLNKLVSNIPLIGLAFGRGNKYGLLGITFRLRGPYSNPRITVNPLSVIAPGVFRKLFEF